MVCTDGLPRKRRWQIVAAGHNLPALLQMTAIFASMDNTL